VKLSPEPGLNLNEMMKTMGKTLFGVFVMGEDILLSEPNVSKLEEAMNNIEFMVVQEPFLNETTRYANVVFPAAVFAEKEGTFANSERRVQRVRKAVEPPAGARADWEILCDLAKACGSDWGFTNTAEVYAEMVRDAPKFAGMSHARIDAETHEGITGLQWPCPTPDHPGTPYLHEGGVLRGKGLFQAVEYRPSMELADEHYELLLSTGRTLYHYNAATQTRRETGLHAKQDRAFVQIHPRDAKLRGIEHGDTVRVSTRRGAIEALAMVSRQVRKGCLWMPLHFAEARANLLTNDAGDPVTGTAEYKVCAAKVERVGTADDASSAYPGSDYHVSGPRPGDVRGAHDPAAVEG